MSYDGKFAMARKTAIAQGKTTFYTGKPCKHGHISPRRVSNKTCITCTSESGVRRFIKLKKKDPAYALWINAKSRAKSYGYSFAIAKEDVLVPERCPCCGRKIVCLDISSRARPDSPSLDRIDSSIGYERGNIAVICWRCNWLKRDATSAELRIIADWMDSRA